MAYDSLKAFVQQYIKQNGNQEITGPVLQNVLLQLITSLGNGFEYVGIADASTNPGSPEGQVFYITKTPGTYTNFLDSTNAPIVVPQGISILKYNGTYWALDSVLKSGDLINVNDANNQSTVYASSAAARAAVPTELRKPGLQITYLLASGWILDQFIGSNISAWTTGTNWQTLGPVSVSQNTLSVGGNYAGELSTTYDVTLHNNGVTFSSLEALLSDADIDTLIPTNVRKGGMSIKFVQSSDNKYIQARCMAQNFTTDVAQWQEVDDEPTAGSKNLVTSGGVSKRDARVMVTGNGGTQVSIEFNGLIPNRPYKIVLTPWNYTNAESVATNAEVFGLYGFLNGYQIAVIKSYSIANKSKVKFVYDVTGNYDALRMYFRIDVGDKVTAEIIDMTNATVGEEGIYNARFGKRYFDLGGYISITGGEAGPDGYSVYGNSFIGVKPGEKYEIENPNGYLIGVARYNIGKEWTSTLWFGSITSITIPDNCYYIKLMARDNNGLTLDNFSSYISLKYIEKVADATVWDWIMSESYTIDSVTRTSGDVSSLSVTWLDGLTGTITLTRNTDGNVSSLAGTHNGSTYTLNVTRNSDGDVIATTKVKS